MTTSIATTPSQSRRLLECGVNPETADMSWVRGAANVSDGDLSLHPYRRMQRINWQSMRGRSEIAPAWSLITLLSLLPKEICDENDDSFYFSLAKELPLTNEYCATYLPCWDKGDALVRKRDNDPIEACVQLIEWLTANNYKLNQL